MYFNFLNKINYLFNGVSYQVKNIFRRPVVSTREVIGIRVDNENTPDKSAIDLYGNPDVFYVNPLINNITQKELWPKTQLEFAESITNEYAGYAFHILEIASDDLERGDIIVLSADLEQCDAGDIDCYPTYGIVEEWIPELRKVWVKNFVIGTKNDATSESDFFAENNKFKVFKRNSNDVVSNLNGVSISNQVAFDSDPNYTFVANIFTMKRVSLYVDSAQKFNFSTDNVDFNPLIKNGITGNIFTTFVGEYNSGNTNGTCSALDAYILEKNGQTGPDGVTFSLDSRYRPTVVLDYLTAENDNERYIYAANREALPSIVDDIERQLNG